MITRGGEMADYRGWNSWLQRGDGVLSDLIGECMTWSAKRSDLRLSLKVKVIKATSGWQRVNYISWWQQKVGKISKLLPLTALVLWYHSMTTWSEAIADLITSIEAKLLSFDDVISHNVAVTLLLWWHEDVIEMQNWKQQSWQRF